MYVELLNYFLQHNFWDNILNQLYKYVKIANVQRQMTQNQTEQDILFKHHFNCVDN